MKRLPVDEFETGSWLATRVDRYSMVAARTNKYSVPIRFIGRPVRILLHASWLVVYDGRPNEPEEVTIAGLRPGTIVRTSAMSIIALC
ncbi:Mu transposase domain-containing protein [Nocardia sp. NBC_01009]|uniref:Mu transposase domain-containing protein n=1 Tax=Nocardia sp. NBC_01009 TaxID=2975996 RepID=UPI003869BE4A|nr:hypothetical protein OHA42_26420 [Nocardia sp. NBC_01009]